MPLVQLVSSHDAAANVNLPKQRNHEAEGGIHIYGYLNIAD